MDSFDLDQELAARGLRTVRWSLDLGGRWLLASEVAEVLGLPGENATIQYATKGAWHVFSPKESGLPTSALFVSEYQFYSLAFETIADTAKPIQDWITRKVLRSRGSQQYADALENMRDALLREALAAARSEAQAAQAETARVVQLARTALQTAALGAMPTTGTSH